MNAEKNTNAYAIKLTQSTIELLDILCFGYFLHFKILFNFHTCIVYFGYILSKFPSSMSPPPISLISHLTPYHLSTYLPLSPMVLPMGSWYGQSTNGLPLKESLSKTGLSVALSYPYWNF